MWKALRSSRMRRATVWKRGWIRERSWRRKRTFLWRCARMGRIRATLHSSTCRARLTCCASASATSPSSRRNWRTRTNGWVRPNGIWPSSTANTRSYLPCFAHRWKSWSAATGGRTLSTANWRNGARALPSFRRNRRATRRTPARWPRAMPTKWPRWNRRIARWPFGPPV